MSSPFKSQGIRRFGVAASMRIELFIVFLATSLALLRCREPFWQSRDALAEDTTASAEAPIASSREIEPGHHRAESNLVSRSPAPPGAIPTEQHATKKDFYKIGAVFGCLRMVGYDSWAAIRGTILVSIVFRN